VTAFVADVNYTAALAAHVTSITGRLWVPCGLCRVALFDAPAVRMTCTEGTSGEYGQQWTCWVHKSSLTVTETRPLHAFGKLMMQRYHLQAAPVD